MIRRCERSKLKSSRTRLSSVGLSEECGATSFLTRVYGHVVHWVQIYAYNESGSDVIEIYNISMRRQVHCMRTNDYDVAFSAQ